MTMGLLGNLIITKQPTTIELLKSFLLKDNKPITKWGLLPDNTFFEGEVPEGYKLAISPSDNIVILDIDSMFANIDNANGSDDEGAPSAKRSKVTCKYLNL